MDVKGFGKKDTQRNLGVSSLTSAPVVHEGIASLWPVLRSVARSGTSGAADSMKIMELSPRELVNKVSGWRFWGNGFSMLILFWGKLKTRKRLSWNLGTNCQILIMLLMWITCHPIF